MKTTIRVAAVQLATTLIAATVLISALPDGAQAAAPKTRSLAAAPLAKGAGYELRNGSQRVRRLQRQLRRLGERPGPIDGLFGPKTERAVRRFQTQAGLARDGVVGPRTATQLTQRLVAVHRRAIKRHKAHLALLGTRAAAVHTDRRELIKSASAIANERGVVGQVALIAALLAGLLIVVCVAPALVPASISGRTRSSATGRLRKPATGADDVVAASTTQDPQRASGTPVIGYVSVGEQERLELGEAYTAQARTIEAFCRERGLRLVRIVRDVVSAGTRAAPTPGLQHACEALARGEARALVIQDLGRLTHSPARLAVLLRWFEDAGRTVIAIAPGLDTSTVAGRKTAAALIEVGEWDHQRAVERRAKSRAAGGGRPSVRDVPELHARIAAMREEGLSLHAIADTLNAERVPTLRGGSRWRPSSVQAAVGYKRPGTWDARRGFGLPAPQAASVDEKEVD